MKKITLPLALVCLLLTSAAYAQIQKGNVLVGADLANFKIGLENDAGFSLDLSPKAGWFIKDNLAIGGYVQFGINKLNKSSPTETTYGIGPLVRYYVNKEEVNLLKHGRLFGEANAGIEGRNISDGGGSTNGLGIGFGPGYAYFITENIGLETLFKWNPLVGFGDDGFQSNFSLHFGLQIYLPGKATLDKVKSDETR
ncbi:MAG TPA: hypothetical protein VFV68_08195 [Agriterribacter sp.]|nr:hypothetical protein [Agriterribacter sp.]